MKEEEEEGEGENEEEEGGSGGGCLKEGVPEEIEGVKAEVEVEVEAVEDAGGGGDLVVTSWTGPCMGP